MQKHDSSEFIGRRHSKGCLGRDQLSFKLDVVRAASGVHIELLYNGLQLSLHNFSHYLLFFQLFAFFSIAKLL